MKILKRIRWIAVLCALACASGGMIHYRERVKEAQADNIIWAELLTALHETDTGLMSVKSGRTTIRYANTDACNIFGYDKMGDVDLGEILPDWFKGAHEQIMLNAMDAATKGTLQKTSSTMPCTAIRKDGTPVEVIVRVVIGKSRVVALVNKQEDMNYLPMKYPMGNPDTK